MEGDSKIRCLQEVSVSLHWLYRKIRMAELHWLTGKWQNELNQSSLLMASNPLVLFSYWMMIYLLSSSFLGLLGHSGVTPDLYCIRKNSTSSTAFAERADGFHPYIQHAVNLYNREKRRGRYKLLRYLVYLHRVQYLLFIVYNFILFIT